ncbi:vesicular, overexpressed in cancer, prosurvival protein 1 isoform X1 [Xiphophorus maculatus]|uniref:vesicular, overexpressed in cancer, prosurvival protein 1 isoform X1 n=1 Tax=Xiphophorus maculatus TaxID=8083 RepID=UPI000293A324|nr:vesicular, overexpressed in cancer, prosurvival protein 1 isoform X1 [Xiphophorus maculatus]XP_032406990.1 vesicular, overexpressed in cancer, prosurvival protein 1 isoform X1 [Xiphophorus hellerii]
MRSPLAGGVAVTLWLLVECVEAKKFCWYFEERYPAYFVCRSYEDCCGTRCCVRALSIQRLWYFWVLLMMGVLFCCGAGFFIRRRMYPSPLRDEPTFNVSFTRQPVTSPVSQQPSSIQSFGVNRMAGGDPGMTLTQAAYRSQPGSTQMMMWSYPPPPSYCNHPPPPYEKIIQNDNKK